MFWIFLTMYPNVIDSSFCSYALEEDRYHYIFIENFSALQETIFWRNYKNSAIVYNRNTYAACKRKCTIDKKILQTEVHKIHLGFSHVVRILKCVWLSAIYISPFLKPVWCMEQCVENHWKDFSLPISRLEFCKSTPFTSVPILWDTTPKQNQVDQLRNLNMVAIYPQLIQTRKKKSASHLEKWWDEQILRKNPLFLFLDFLV